ncbi:MAG: hypothetical protein HGA22_11745, partial [Clostridiales bacterium]|nr:hypothetical protein [Clostridiales bacterium]
MSAFIQTVAVLINPRLILLVPLLVFAVASDLRHYRIRNRHLAIFGVAGLLVSILNFQNPATSAQIISILFPVILPLVLLFPLYCLKMLGAGDVKLFCSIGAIMG